MRKSRRRSNTRKRKFGPLPPFPPKVGKSKEEQIGTVLGSLALRQSYLNSPEYKELAYKIKDFAIKELRDDTIIKSIVKVLKGDNDMYNKIKKILSYYNFAVIVSNEIS